MDTEGVYQAFLRSTMSGNVRLVQDQRNTSMFTTNIKNILANFVASLIISSYREVHPREQCSCSCCCISWSDVTLGNGWSRKNQDMHIVDLGDRRRILANHIHHIPEGLRDQFHNQQWLTGYVKFKVTALAALPGDPCLQVSNEVNSWLD